MTGVLDREEAVKKMQKVLDDTGANQHIQADSIAEWIDIDNGLGLGIDDSMKILSGLIFMEVLEREGTVDNYMSALMDLYNSINSKMPKPDLKREKMRVQLSEFKIPPDDWVPHYSKAMVLMRNSEFLEASDEFGKVFEMLLDEPTTRGDLYRIYYNASLAHFMGGRPNLGELCLHFSINLNPNYSLAREKAEEIDKGEMNDFIKLGMLNRMQETIDEGRKILNPKRYAGRSEKSLIRELEGYGIKFSKEELLKASRESVSRDEVVRSLFLDRIDRDSPEADNVWGIAHTLWDRSCSEEPVAELIIDICAEIENILEESEKPSFKKINRLLADIEKIIYSGKNGVVEKWSKYSEYSSSDRHTLMDMFALFPDRKDFRNRFLKLSDHLYITLDDPFWSIPSIISGEGDITDIVDEMRSKYLEFYFLHVYLYLKYLEDKDLDKAHEAILEAVDVVEKNRKSKTRYKWNLDSDLSDMEHVYPLLEQFYEYFDSDDKHLDLLKRGMKTIARLEKKSEEKSDKELSGIIKEKLEFDPAFKYMEFVEKLSIDFHTEEVPEVTIRNIEPSYERTRSSMKVGRNEPCPCGSGKKYKKCCLRFD